MTSTDISSLIVGSPPTVFDPHYSPPKPPLEFEQLQEACTSGHLDDVRKLSKTGKITRDQLIHGLTVAQQNGHTDLVSYLLSIGAPIQVFHVEDAIRSSEYHLLELFLKSGYEINTPINWNTPSLLIRSFHDVNLCKWLIEQGADPNTRCILDITPLSVAVQEASFEIIRLLFDRGGSVEYGQILHYAIRRDSEDYLEVLSFVLDKSPPINQVMFEDHSLSYEMQKDFGIGTPLHEAVAIGKIDVIKTLLARGADPNIKDSKGQSAVEKANQEGKTEILKVFRT
ncbi:hypothetical protein N7490_001792 [Penicillium lividum]|nr:hypothetical protein N7490_001792 [Penicillium lividum]